MLVSLSSLALCNLSTRELEVARKRFRYGLPTSKLSKCRKELVNARKFVRIFATDVFHEKENDYQEPDYKRIRYHSVSTYLPSTIVVKFFCNKNNNNSKYRIKVFDKDSEWNDWVRMAYNYQHITFDDDDVSPEVRKWFKFNTSKGLKLKYSPISI
jgi:hypothetical protein